MKAVLIQSPCWMVDSPPYNLALLKAVCEKQGHRVNCLDLNAKFYRYLGEEQRAFLYNNQTNWYSYDYADTVIGKYSEFINEWVDKVINIGSKVVGFTVTGLNIRFSQKIAEIIKNRDNSKIIIFGGPHCFKTELGEKLLYDASYIDVVCYLEGENVLPYLLNDIEKYGGVKCLAGIGYRDKNGRVIDCGLSDLIVDLNSLPFADYSDFNFQEYTSKELPISTSRGCINRCAFCNESVIWRKYRFRNAENVFEEMKFQLSKYPFIRSFFLNDSLINGNIRELNRLCDLMIDSKIGVIWGGQTLIREEMTDEFVHKMRRAGFSHASYGLESASPRMLKMMKKRFTPRLAERVIRDSKRSGIYTDVNIIVGFPTESEEDVILTANFLKRNRKFIDGIFYHPLVMSKGSYVYEHMDDFGIILENAYNLNGWYSTKEENTLQKRLKVVKFYEEYVGGKGKSFLTLADYYFSIANLYFNNGDYKTALAYYMRSRKANNNSVKGGLINKQIELAQERISDS